MMKISQTKLAKEIEISDGFLSQIMTGKRRPSWKVAKKIAKTTGTDPVLWLEGKPEEMRAALNTVSSEAA